MMLERRCTVPGKNLPDTEKWLCSDCFVWRGLASMAQPVRPAAQALQQVEALTGLRPYQMARMAHLLAPAGLLAGSTVRTKFAASMRPVRSGSRIDPPSGHCMVRRKVTPPGESRMANRLTKLVATIVFIAGTSSLATVASATPVANGLAI